MTKFRNILAVHYLAFALIVSSVTLGFGCAVTPKSPAQAVYLAHGDYAAALTIAVQYKNLPACGGLSATPICRDTATLKKLQAADDKAFDLLSSAQSAVRVGSASPEGEQATAVSRAQQAVADFSNLTSTVKVKP